MTMTITMMMGGALPSTNGRCPNRQTHHGSLLLLVQLALALVVILTLLPQETAAARSSRNNFAASSSLPSTAPRRPSSSSSEAWEEEEDYEEEDFYSDEEEEDLSDSEYALLEEEEFGSPSKDVDAKGSSSSTSSTHHASAQQQQQPKKKNDKNNYNSNLQKFKKPSLESAILNDDNDHDFDDDFDDGDLFDDFFDDEQDKEEYSMRTTDKKSLSLQKSKGAMYDAYNQLHSLAQEYDKPFDAPAVVVVGHQSSGKSALIEALMGFQFNQVGGGTKTRRPVALRMQYNPSCSEPRWFLLGQDGVERPMSLSSIQEYIDEENSRLERDPMRSFDPQEINIRMEYKHCPNMILIDTPGLISAPRVPRGRRSSSGRNGNGGNDGDDMALSQQRALQASAREAERLVVQKMQCEDYIILCVEDTNDWKHGTTREVVQKADPDLSRTVIVNTKFDTKVPQFGTPSDIQEFLLASILERISPHKLGGPFFTSVPSGRVGRSSDMDGGDYFFETDDDFVAACGEAENADRGTVHQRLKRLGGGGGNKNKASATRAAGQVAEDRIGLANLRTFLENRVDECYRRNIQKIIPMLQAEYTAADRRLQACERELEALSVERLQGGVDKFCDEFCASLRKALQGTIVAPTTLFGETLRMETTASGSFHDIPGAAMAVSDRTWERLVETDVGNKDHKLYGGSQYHRTLREFHLATRCLRFPTIADDEIANAAGIGETHDGVNFLHAACTIALEKARVSFEPMLARLQMRMVHVMSRLGPVTEYMLRENRERAKLNGYTTYLDEHGGSSSIGSIDVSQNPQFRQLIRGIYDTFIQTCAENAMNKCRDDMLAITKYVTWSLDSRGGGTALTQALPDQTDMVSVYQVAVKSAHKASSDNTKNPKDDKKDAKSDNSKDKKAAGALTPEQKQQQQQQALAPVPDRNQSSERDYQNLIQLMEEAFASRDAERTNLVVAGLVQHIVSGWRDQFCKSVVMKFNCYFMLPFVDQFHLFLRTRLREIYEGQGADNLSDVLDIAAARRALEKDRARLVKECRANKNLQDKFRHIAKFMKDSSSPN